jgi:stage II sporulation protein R
MFSLKNKVFDRRRDIAFLCVVAIVVSLYSAYSLAFFAKASDMVRQDTVRLHILANSDSEEDQAVKLMVRDALLRESAVLCGDYTTVEAAEEYFRNNKDSLTEIANRVLIENGFTYTATVTLTEEYYETRQYGDLTFPAGVYTSLRVILGEGEGHNWWCVMFPNLCVPVAGDIETDDDELDNYSSGGKKVVGEKYQVKFKIIEFYERLKNKFR